MDDEKEKPEETEDEADPTLVSTSVATENDDATDPTLRSDINLGRDAQEVKRPQRKDDSEE